MTDIDENIQQNDSVNTEPEPAKPTNDIEKPKKPRSEKQVEAWKKCLQARKDKASKEREIRQKAKDTLPEPSEEELIKKEQQNLLEKRAKTNNKQKNTEQERRQKQLK